MKVTNINFNEIRLNSKEYLKQCMIKWDRNIGGNEDQFTYIKDFGEEEIYDNRSSSTILNKARTNILQLNDRN